MSGSATDVFRLRSGVAGLAASPGTNADEDYFGLSLFEYLKRKLLRGAQE